ncbi:hypothetical protein PBPRB1309 [Photobacterium profundum SS9]|uniref:Uncharacterized protein n=2 Tax=Photobacterium profundum TaxID=74109 RepID=Q6LHQ0_PHOPR|nr:hypothetical protein PBPRB1309 [Photobacterium profundum SS9]
MNKMLVLLYNYEVYMEFSEFLNQIFLPYGGTSVVVVAIAGFIGKIISKNIINGELAKHKLELESLKSKNTLKLEVMKQDYNQKIEFQKIESTRSLESVKNDLQKEIMKHEVYTSISKEKYQELFQLRIELYGKFLKLKKEIDDSILDNAEYFEFQDEDPKPFTSLVEKINEASRENPMLMSNELAKLSSELYEKSSRVFSDAKVSVAYAEQNMYGQDSPQYEVLMEAEDSELRKMHRECGDIYNRWFVQLELDVSRIRSILDITNDFLGEKY